MSAGGWSEWEGGEHEVRKIWEEWQDVVGKGKRRFWRYKLR